MPILYRTFAALRTVFCAVFAAFIFVGAPPALAENPLFTVKDVQVDITAASALEARNQAFAAAQQEAFKRLAAQVLPAAEAASLPAPDPKAVSALIQDYEITQEKISSVRYVGTYTFRFKERAVRNYLSVPGNLAAGQTPYAPAPAARDTKPLLILPYYQTAARPMIWGGYNGFMEAWRRNPRMDGLVSFVLPLGDLADVQDMDDDQALSFDERRLARMCDRYDCAEVVILIAAQEDGLLRVGLYRTDRGVAELARTLNIQAAPGEDSAALYDRAVAEVQETLRKDWKGLQGVQGGVAQMPSPPAPTLKPHDPTAQMPQAAVSSYRINARVPFESFQQWTAIQRSLRRVAGVADITIKALTPRQAMIEIAYNGDTADLYNAFQQIGLMIRPEGGSGAGAMHVITQMQRLNFMNGINPSAGDARPLTQAPPMSAHIPAPVQAAPPPAAPRPAYRQNF